MTDLLPAAPVEHPEEVVVAAGHDGRVSAVPAALGGSDGRDGHCSGSVVVVS